MSLESCESGLRRPQHMHNYAHFGGTVYELTIAEADNVSTK